MKQEFAEIVDFLAKQSSNAEIIRTTLSLVFRKGRRFRKTREEKKRISVIIGIVQFALHKIREGRDGDREGCYAEIVCVDSVECCMDDIVD
jgi:hypothetical protein